MQQVAIRGFLIDPAQNTSPVSPSSAAEHGYVVVKVNLPDNWDSLNCAWLMETANAEFMNAGVQMRLVGLLPFVDEEDDEEQPHGNVGDESGPPSAWMIDPNTMLDTMDLTVELEAVFMCDKLCVKTSSGASSKVSASDFEFIRLLGEGAEGKVFQVRRKKTGKNFAVKVIEKKRILGSHKKYSQALVERQVLVEARHPFIVQLHWTFQTRSHLYFVLEFCLGGELYYHLARQGRFDENTARFYFAEILLGLEYLHARNIVHRDLKVENILLDEEGHVRLTDFGVSKVVKDETDKFTSVVGTSEYMAPELILKEGYSKPFDFYCLGCVLYFMLTGRLPYFRGDFQEMARQRVRGDFLPFPADVSIPAQNLCRKLLEPDPASRMGSNGGAEEVRQHPWLTGIEWPRVHRKLYKPPVDPKRLGDNFDPNFTKRALPPLITSDGINTSASEGGVKVPDWSFAEASRLDN
jgi:serine/threonine protein kinase